MPSEQVRQCPRCGQLIETAETTRGLVFVWHATPAHVEFEATGSYCPDSGRLLREARDAK